MREEKGFKMAKWIHDLVKNDEKKEEVKVAEVKKEEAKSEVIEKKLDKLYDKKDDAEAKRVQLETKEKDTKSIDKKIDSIEKKIDDLEDKKKEEIKKEAIDPPPETTPEKRKLPVTEVPKRIEPQEVEELKSRSPQITKEVADVAKEANQALKELYSKVMKLQATLDSAEKEAKAASEKILSEAKAPKLQEQIRLLSQQLEEEIGEGQRVAVAMGDSILGKIEDQSEKSDYKYYVETEADVLKYIKGLEEDKKNKIEAYKKELDAAIEEYKQRVAKGIEKIVTTKVRLVTFPKLSMLVKSASIISAIKDAINSFANWIKGLSGLQKKIEAL